MEDNFVQFDIPTNTPKIIKVIGVGGGGCNAVNHMYNEGINDVAFMVCNTDSKALNDSPVPDKLQLGKGLGAGNNPEEGRKAAEESIDEIRAHLSDGTQMVFITAGLGGGTGTGAAPIIARVAMEMGILTVGIVTIPYHWEGDKKVDQALDGLEELQQHLDSIIVIPNDRLTEFYNEMDFEEAYDKADDVSLEAAKSISDIITMHGRINLDFNDVRTILRKGGVAFIGTGYSSGENRVSKAIADALSAPLLVENDIFHSQKVAFCISYSTESKLMMNEMDEVKEFMSRFSRDIETKHGVEKDEKLGNQIKITLLATGFGMQDLHLKQLEERIANRTEEEQEKLDAEAERKRKRREGYYGKNTNNSTSRTTPRHIYLFNPEDLDNAEVITMVEEKPTYLRNRSELKEIKAKAAEASRQAEETKEEPQVEAGDIISF